MTSRRSLRSFGPPVPWPVAITIPARDEADRVLPCLDAAAASLRGRGGIVLEVNGARDDTFARAEGWFSATGAPGLLIDDPAPPGGGSVGRARRDSIAACRDRLTPDAALMTTDADSRVAPDWIDANLAELSGADLICGTVLPDPEEFARLPVSIGQRGAPEGEYLTLTLLAREMLDPLPWDPAPTHLNAAGASLAFRAALYDDIGGFAGMRTAEDRAFAALAEARGWRLRHSARAQVVTTCRLDGRTEGGMAGALRARIADADPLVDEVLEPAAQTIRRARLRGITRQQVCAADFPAVWAALAAADTALRPQRMHMSDLLRELPLLSKAVAMLSPPEAKESA